jgi:EAL domain-containing protein (putative c-di-GMP-specific phosphodiesterase class I)
MMQSLFDGKLPRSVGRSQENGVRVWILAAVGADSASNQLTVVFPTPFTIGRKPGVSLQINSRTVSSQHAELTIENGKLILQDMGSTNGTYVNGQRITGRVALQGDEYIQFADVAFRLRCDEPSTASHTECQDVCDQALALVQFDRLMQNRLVTPFFQPIIDISSGAIVGYEVLARSRLLGLESSQAMFSAAGRLNMEAELSAMLRWEALNQDIDIPDDFDIYLNTHPRELVGFDLVDSMRKLREIAPNRSMVLEIHEAAVTSPEQMRLLRSELAAMDIRLAYDDFGAGQNRLAELGEAPPDILKFDMALIRDIDQALIERRKMIASLISMVKDLGIISLAEGIETQGEAEQCALLGFDLAQGFYYGRPAPPPRHSFDSPSTH